MTASLLTFAVLAAPLSAFPGGEAFGVEVLSDITSPSNHEGRALQIKNEQFWRPILQAAGDQEVQKHAMLYREAEEVIEWLRPEHQYVSKALHEALQHLRRADAAVLRQAHQHAQLASEQLAAPMDGDSEAFSFFTGGQSFIALAMQRFTDFGTYFSRLRRHIDNRQVDALPALKGTAAASADVLQSCRAASRRGFDVLKYDIYERGVVKTPEVVKTIANRIIDAAADTRRCFLRLVTATAEGVIRDVEHASQNPSALVTRTLLEDLEPLARDSGMKMRLGL